MIEDPREFPTNEPPAEAGAVLPFPYNQQTFCRYEPIEKQIEKVRVLVVDSLLRDEDDLSDVARTDWGKAASLEIKRERRIANMAIENIVSNIERLVKEPTTQITPLASIAIATRAVRARRNCAERHPARFRLLQSCRASKASPSLSAQTLFRCWRSAADTSSSA